MNVIDIVLLALLLLGIVRGFMKGLFVEIASLVALIAGVYGAIHFSYYVANYLHESVSWDEQYINVVAFAATFVIIIILIAMAGKALTKLADFAALGILNKILGATFGGLKFGFIMSVILIIFAHFNKSFTLIEEQQIEESMLYKPVKNLAPMIFPEIIKKGEELEDELLGE